MPASLTRPCARCEAELPIALFRDPGEEHLTGRPSRVCRACRAKDPVLVARLEASRAHRASRRATARGYADRVPEQVSLARMAKHPRGLKACPSLAGCGRTFPLSAFSPDRYQPDGLRSVCDACAAESRALRAS